eukprot:GEMP01018171.1.p1 GENE.GEMP01018171.1~~GEMP01018171.1.p1  ORF type:complete len:565 (+),score=96.95 GEMP01018171.1:51-1745(+)
MIRRILDFWRRYFPLPTNTSVKQASAEEGIEFFTLYRAKVSSPTSVFFAFEKAERVGCVLTYINGKVVVYVRPEYRSRGHGTRLLQRVEGETKLLSLYSPMQASDSEWFAKRGYEPSENGLYLEKRMRPEGSEHSPSLRRRLENLGCRRHMMPRFQWNFPDVVLTHIFNYLGDVASIGRMGCVSVQLRDKVNDGEVWQLVIERCFWSKQSTDLCTKELVKARAETPVTLAIDIGRGYTKWALVHPLMPRIEGKSLQLCSSPTHPPEAKSETQIFAIQKQAMDVLDRARRNPSDPLHKKAMRLTDNPNGLLCVKTIPHVVATPFICGINRYPPINAGIKSAIRDAVGCSLLPQPILCAASLGLRNACVVNFGLVETVACHCKDGVQKRTELIPFGGSTLTIALLDILIEKYNVHTYDCLTRCRDIKEQYLAISPRPLGGCILHPVGCPAEEPETVYFYGIEISLNTERWAVPELLFQQQSTNWSQEGGRDSALTDLIFEVCAGDEEALDNIVLCGMTSKLPNLGERLEWELNRARGTKATVRHVLPDLPLQAACIHAANILPRQT